MCKVRTEETQERTQRSHRTQCVTNTDKNKLHQSLFNQELVRKAVVHVSFFDRWSRDVRPKMTQRGVDVFWWWFAVHVPEVPANL